VDTQSTKADISFTTQEVSYTLESVEAVSSWLHATALAHHRSIATLEYIFCSDDYLLEINKQYLDHDYYTDIITFPLQESPLEATVFISIDRVRENAELYNNTFLDELHRVVVHGLLHLLGYKDSTDDDKAKMRLKEDECLAKRTFL